MSKAIPLAKPYLDSAEIRAVTRVIRSGWVTQGSEVEKFEKEFARKVGAKHAVAVSSGTAGLHLALHALGVGPGDEVITASHSFIATANAIWMTGATPVFVDVSLDDFNIDPEQIERAVTRRTRAILPIHQFGMPCNMAAIKKIAKRRKIAVVEDAACALGSEIKIAGKWQKIGKPVGDAACFSFHPRKVITTGDGGMITTSSAALAKSLRLLRQHGMDINALKRQSMKNSVREDYIVPGFNYRMTDVQAAMGRAQLQKLSKLLSARRNIAQTYSRTLDEDRFSMQKQPSYAKSNWQSFAFRSLRTSESRKLLNNSKVKWKQGIQPTHKTPAYRSVKWRSLGKGMLRNSEILAKQQFVAPIFLGMTRASVKTVSRLLGRDRKRT